MKLGEVGLYKKESGETPVLLLDDVFSELDEERRKILLDVTRDVQSLITCTEFDPGTTDCRVIRVIEGRAEAVK